MPSTYSSRLRLEQIGTGEQSGAWGTTLNYQLGTLVEQAIAGHGVVTMGNGDYTLSVASGGVDEARNAVLTILSSVSLTATRAVIIPAVSKVYAIRNLTSGGQAIVVRVAGGIGVTIANGANQILFTDGVNCQELSLAFGANQTVTSGNMAVSGTLAVAGASTHAGPSTFSSTVTLAADPGIPMGAATKQYVDQKAYPITGGYVLGGLGSSIPAAPSTGVVYLGNTGTKYLQWDGQQYFMPGGELFVNGQKVWHAGNLSAPLPLTGGTLTGGLIQGSGNAFIRGDANVNEWFQTSTGAERGVLYYNQPDNTMRLRVAGSTGVAVTATSGMSIPGSVISGSFGYFQTPRTADNGFGRAMINSDNRFGNWMWNDGGGFLQIQIDGGLRSVASSPSDLRLKEDITPASTSALAKIEQLDFIDFRFLPLPGAPEGVERPIQRGGVSGQQAQEIEPAWVHVMPDEPGTLNLNTTLLLTNALQAIKELSARVRALEAAAADDASVAAA